MKKDRRSIRQRVNESDSENENHNDENKSNTKVIQITENKTIKPAKSNLKKVSTASSILSFDIEEGVDESFKIKKSSHNKKVVRQLKKAQKQAKKDESDLNFKTHKKQNFNIEEVKKDEENDYFGDEISEEEEKSDSTKSKHFTEILKSGGIPDANLIHLLKQKRQQAKGEDFIALDNTTTSSKSRLIREDDNDASDDEGCSNMMSSLSQKHKDLERRKIEETILTAQDESDSEKDHEWEEVQMKKAMSDSQFLFENKNATQASNMPTHVCYNQINGEMKFNTKKSLRQRLYEAQNKCSLNKHDREEIKNRIKMSLLDTELFSGKKESLNTNYKFYQQMQAFVLDYVDCMNEKMSSITYLERCLNQLLQQRVERLIARRKDDVNDQSIECQQGKVGVDGNDEVRKRRKAEREGRRARRRRARENKSVLEHKEGWSTDDELTHSEENKFKNEKERLTEGCKTCMDDVVEEFHSIPKILARFSQWKNSHQTSYNDAYIGLCISRLLTPLIKLQLITWNPLETYCRNFEKSPWFIDLLNYGTINVDDKDAVRKSSDEEESRRDIDPDVKLLPNIIDKILVNKLTGVVDNLWDPMSSEQSRNLRKVVGQVFTDYSLYIHDSKHLPNLISSINKRLLKSIDTDLYIPLYARSSIEDHKNPASGFFYRQMNTCLKAFSNILMWQGVLSDQYLQMLALEKVLNRYLVTAIQTAPINSEIIFTCQSVSSAVPQNWFSEYMEGVCIPQLEQFCRLVVTIAHKIHSSGVNDSKAQVKQLGKVLLRLHAEAQANQLSSLIHSSITLD